MTSLIMAWLVGEGLIVWRSVAKQRRPPLPAELLVTSGLFLLLALLAEKDAKLASLLAWGFVTAAWISNPPTKIAPGSDAVAGNGTGGSGGSGSQIPGGHNRLKLNASALTRPPSSSGSSAAPLSA